MRLKNCCPEKGCPGGYTTFCDTLKLTLLIHWDISRRKKEKKKEGQGMTSFEESINDGWRSFDCRLCD